MPEYFLCPVCSKASEQWGQLRGHIMGAHKTEIDPTEIPSKEEIQTVDELPEGYQLMSTKEKKKAPVRARAGAEPEEEPTRQRATVDEEPPPKKKIRVPTEMPEDFLDRTELSLTVHNFPTALATQILNVLALHPETHDNPNNFANLLAHICSTYPGGATHARKIGLLVSEVFGPPTQEMPYTAYPSNQPAGLWGGNWGQTGGGYSPYGQPYGGHSSAQPDDPISQWIKYQMYKESKREEGEKEAKIPQAFQAELDAMRQYYEESNKASQEILSALDEQRKKGEEDARKAEIDGLRAEIRAASEGKKGGGENEWLMAFLAEREKREDEAKKRLEDIISAQGERLATATNELSKASQDVDRRVLDTISREKTLRAEIHNELKESGWSQGTRTKEELDHELWTQGLSIIPEKIDKGFDRIADRFPMGSQQIQTTSPPAQSRARPVGEIAEQTALEDTILEEMRRRGQS